MEYLVKKWLTLGKNDDEFCRVWLSLAHPPAQWLP